MRNIFLAILALVIVTSCSNKKRDEVTKFVYIDFCGVSSDRTLKIGQYFEYKQNVPIKISTGDCFEDETKLNHGLVNFYHLTPNDTFSDMLTKAFCEIPYGKKGNQHVEMFNGRDATCCFKSGMFRSLNFFIIETAENRKIAFKIYPDSLTTELKAVYTFVKNVFNSYKLIKATPFEVDTSVEELQKSIFLNFPPPPPPPEVLEQKVKFTAPPLPKQQKKDTIVMKENTDSAISLPSPPQ